MNGWTVGAVLLVGFLLGRRGRSGPAAPPTGWGAPHYPQNGVSAKGVMAIIVLVAGVLFGATMLPGAAKSGAPHHGSAHKSGGLLESILGGVPSGKLKLPKIALPKPAKIGGKAAKVPHGLSFTNGAGCRPKGDWSRVDPRVRTVLANIAKHHAVRVSCLHTGHSRFVKGTRRVSNHTVWRAADIDRVDGRAVRSWNLNALAVARALGRGEYGAQPSEVGSPWGLGGLWFTDAGHKNHLHFGFRSR